MRRGVARGEMADQLGYAMTRRQLDNVLLAWDRQMKGSCNRPVIRQFLLRNALPAHKRIIKSVGR